MGRVANVSLGQALRYRGGQPMWAWLLHRISGIGIVLFVFMHVVSAFFLYSVEGPAGSIAQFLTMLYESLPTQIFILFAVLFHAINGLRVAVLDMWPGLIHHNREVMWLQWALFVPMFVLPAGLMLLGLGAQ